MRGVGGRSALGAYARQEVEALGTSDTPGEQETRRSNGRDRNRFLDPAPVVDLRALLGTRIALLERRERVHTERRRHEPKEEVL
jgi:hypothetical protein